MNFLLIAILTLASIASASPLDKSKSVRGTAPTAKTTGRKIIRLKDGVNQRTFDQQLKSAMSKDASAGPNDNTIIHQYTTRGVKGYAGKFTKAIEDSLKANPMVESVEEDFIGWVEGEQQTPPSWGQSRISSRTLTTSDSYKYSNKAGEGVTAYIIDTGIDVTHKEFEGRGTFGVNFIKGEADADLDGHGTHVAGTIAGTTFGLAKKAKVVAVKVCNQFGQCATSDVIAGLQWVIKNGVKNKSVVNISLGLAASQALDDTVQAAVDAGVAIIVSGGNANTDSCLNSPRRAPASFAVGATDNADGMASFSNWGKCLKIFAPGVDIVSAKPGNESQKMSGTSMASPHVAGVAALYLGDKEYTSIPELHKDLIARASKDVVKNLRNADKTINLLAYSRLTDEL